jgi:integral membrane protein
LKSTKTFSWFRKIAFAEGVSFLVLLFIGMPLKYMAGYPMATMIAGSLHGVLFVAFIILAFEVKGDYKMSFAWLAKSLIASVIPFGTFVMEKQWKREELAVNM